MTPDEFHQEYQGYFYPTQEDVDLDKLAEEYHQRCEAYDQLVCSGQIKRGVAMPTNEYEHRKINKNAIAVLKEIKYHGRLMGYTGQEIGKAISHWGIGR